MVESTRRARAWLVPAALLALACATTCCGRSHGKLRIGIKPFVEQKLLAEMVVRLLRQADLPVGPVIRCDDTYTCHKRLRDGEVDMLLEYTGTGMLFLPGRIARDRINFRHLQQQYAPLGIRWLLPLGFSNSYQLVVRTDRATSMGLSSIGDLARLPQGVRVATPVEYPRRSLDGLYPLVRRYGLELAGEVRVEADPVERLRLLLQDKVDAIVLYATDGITRDTRITILRDPLDFFPPYEAAVVVREEVAEAFPNLRRVLAPLHSRLDANIMQALNYAVQVQGRRPVETVADFLFEQGLVTERKDERGRVPPLRVAMHDKDSLATFGAAGLLAVRQAFHKRTVQLRSVAHPLAEVARAKSRLAIVGAERFFRHDEVPPTRDDRVVAVAVLGTRVLHVIRRADDDRTPLDGRVGIPLEGSGGNLVAGAVLAAVGKQPHVEQPVFFLVDAVSKKELDCALVLAPLGDTEVTRALEGSKLALRPLATWATAEHLTRAPYLRPVRIPAGTYAGQDAPIESLGNQVVIAAPSPSLTRMGNMGNPGVALPSTGHPLTPEQAMALAQASGIPESVDPILPTPWVEPRAEEKTALSPVTAFGRILNVLLFIFIAFWVWLIIRREPGEEETS